MITYAEIGKRLEKAADAIRTNGLAKRTYNDEDNKLCSLGGIRVSVMGRVDFNPWMDAKEDQYLLKLTERFFQDYIEENFPEIAYTARVGGTSIVPFWNDRDERTEDEVVDAMLLASKEAFAKQGDILF